METAASQRSSNEPVLHHGRVDCDALDATVRRQLLAELESALAFADYCSFIGRERVSSCAEELVSLAQKLYEDTLSSMHTSRTPPA